MLKSRSKLLMLPGFSGFIGLMGFRYFSSGDPQDLFYFGFFALFAFFILGSLKYDFQDERWRENYHKACTVALYVSAVSIFLIGITAAWSLLTQEMVIVGCALAWVLTILTYAVAFRVYEKQ